MNSPVLVHDFLKLSSRQYPKKEALICEKRPLSYEELDRRCCRLADFFVQSGLGCQERVAVFLDDSAEGGISIYSTLRAGGAFIVVNGSVKPRKLGYILRDGEVSILVADAAKAALSSRRQKTSKTLKRSGRRVFRARPIFIGPLFFVDGHF